ncbi:MAG: hypothetical protein IJ488_01485 [Clostridia bacterium]|nr:hypothetical protein [Clostridia bacterium]
MLPLARDMRNMKTVLLDERVSEECLRSLILRGFSPITLPCYPALPEAIGAHCDTLLFKLGNTLITSADYCEYASFVFSDLRERHPNLNIIFSSDALGKEYPEDCRFNALTVGKNIVCRRESISESVIRLAESCGLTAVDSKQGYAACTVLMVDEKNAVTADKGMARLLRSLSVKVTEISEGGISLPPYEYGFIGGASFVFGDTVYFFGNPARHPDGELICAALTAAGKKICPLSDAPLTDIGGAAVFE